LARGFGVIDQSERYVRRRTYGTTKAQARREFLHLVHWHSHVQCVHLFSESRYNFHRGVNAERVANVCCNTTASQQRRALHCTCTEKQGVSRNAYLANRFVSPLNQPSITIPSKLSYSRAWQKPATCLQETRNKGFGHGLPFAEWFSFARIIPKPTGNFQSLPTHARGTVGQLQGSNRRIAWQFGN
jgi:hypothetical protein